MVLYLCLRCFGAIEGKVRSSRLIIFQAYMCTHRLKLKWQLLKVVVFGFTWIRLFSSFPSFCSRLDLCHPCYVDLVLTRTCMCPVTTFVSAEGIANSALHVTPHLLLQLLLLEVVNHVLPDASGLAIRQVTNGEAPVTAVLAAPPEQPEGRGWDAAAGDLVGAKLRFGPRPADDGYFHPLVQSHYFLVATVAQGRLGPGGGEIGAPDLGLGVVIAGLRRSELKPSAALSSGRGWGPVLLGDGQRHAGVGVQALEGVGSLARAAQLEQFGRPGGIAVEPMRSPITIPRRYSL